MLAFNFCADLQRALDAERVFFGGGMIDYLRQNPEMYGPLTSGGPGPSFPSAVWAVCPHGWFDFEKVSYQESFEHYRLPGLDLPNQRISPTACKRAENELAGLGGKPWPLLLVRHRVFSALMFSGFSGAFRKTAFSQDGAGVAAIACALERYRLAHQAFPKSLKNLPAETSFIADRPLPLDVINGELFQYGLLDDGLFVLYSVGWDERDDHASIVSTKANGDVPKEGDWVWRPL